MSISVEKRDRGSFAWRFAWLHNKLGLSQTKMGSYLGSGLKKTTIQKLCQDRHFETMSESKQRRIIERLRKALPEAYAEYLINGGDRQPPEINLDAGIREIEERRDFGAEFERLTEGDEGLRKALQPVSVRRILRDVMDDFGLSFEDAEPIALAELAAMNRKDVADYYIRMRQGFVDCTHRVGKAAEVRENYGEQGVVVNGNEALSGAEEGRALPEGEQKKRANGGN